MLPATDTTPERRQVGSETARDTARHGLVVGLAAAGLAAIVVLHHLGTKPLWLDESVTVSVATRPLHRLLSVLPHQDANAGLYYLVMHFWLRLGHTTAWDRGVSAACFVATAGAASWLATRWRGVWFGSAVALLIVTNGFLLFYGQEARPYSAAVLLAVLSTAALFWHEDEPAYGPYVLLTVLLLYTDLFAALFVVAQAAGIVIVHRRRYGSLPPRRLFSCWALIGGLTAPLFLLMTLVERSQISWIQVPSLGYLELTVREMTNGRLGLVIVLGLAAVAIAGIRRLDSPRDRLVLAALAVACVAPPVLLWLAGQVLSVFVDRYVISSTVAAIGLAAFGLERVARRSVAAATVLLLLLVVVGGRAVLDLERAPYKYEDPPVLVAFVARHTLPGDAVGFGSPGLRTVVDSYLRPGTAFPVDVALAPGGQAWLQDEDYARELSPALLVGRLASVDRLWFVTDPLDHGYPTSGSFFALRTSILRSFQRAATTHFPGIDVTLYVRRSGHVNGRTT